MKKIRVISLGEIITPTLAKGISALIKLIAANNSSTHEHIKSQVQWIIKKINLVIEKFKQGIITEAEFNGFFIEEIYMETGVKLSVQQLDYAWSAMNPVYEAFRDQLSAAIGFNKINNQQLIFVSYSNPKDMRQLLNELVINNIAHQQDNNGNLCEIDGIKLHLSYVYKTTKVQLLKNIFADLQKQPSQSNSVFSTRESLDIKYIHSVSEIEFNTFINSYSQFATSSKSTIGKFRIDTIFWNNKSVSFADLLKNENPAHSFAMISSL